MLEGRTLTEAPAIASRRTEVFTPGIATSVIEGSASEWMVNTSNEEVEFMVSWPDDDGRE